MDLSRPLVLRMAGLAAAGIGTLLGIVLAARGSPFWLLGPAVPGFAGLLLILPHRGPTERHGPRAAGIVLLASGLLLAGALVAGFGQGARPVSFFALAAASGALAALAAACDRRATTAGFWIVAVLALLVRLSSLLSLSTFQGVDSFNHLKLAEDVVEAQHLPEDASRDKYAITPFMHLTGAATSRALGISLESAFILALSVPQVVLVPLVALLTRGLNDGARVGVAAFLAFQVDLVLNAVNFTPGSLTLVYWIGIIALWPATGARRGLLAAGLAAAALMTHQLTVFVMTSILVLGVLMERILQERSAPVRGASFALAFALAFIVMVGFIMRQQGVDFLGAVVGPFFDTVGDAEPLAQDTRAVGQVATPLSNLLYKLSTAALSGAALAAGALSLRRGTPAHGALGLGAAAMVVPVFLLPFFGFQNFVTERWVPVIAVGLVVPLATAWVHWQRPLGASIPVLAMLLFAGITSPIVNIDAPFYAEDRNVGGQFTLADVAAAQFSVDAGASLRTDLAFASGYLQQARGAARLRDSLFLEDVADPDERLERETLVILRPDVLETGPLFVRDQYRLPAPATSLDVLEAKLQRAYLVYDNGPVTMHYVPVAL